MYIATFIPASTIQEFNLVLTAKVETNDLFRNNAVTLFIWMLQTVGKSK
jgi:hypothetical protein